MLKHVIAEASIGVIQFGKLADAFALLARRCVRIVKSLKDG